MQANLLFKTFVELLYPSNCVGCGLAQAGDAFVPVPLHPARHRERGFNQAEALAKSLSKKTAIPVLDCMERRSYTQTQTRFDRAERMRNLRNAFVLRKNSVVFRKNLVLLDD